MPGRYFNWKLAIVLVIALVVLGVSAFGLRRWRRSNRAEQGLVLGNKAYSEHRWAEAAENLGSYIAMVRDDVPVLLKYADAQLKIRPSKPNNVRQAIDAYRIVLRVDRNNSEAARRLTEIYLGIGSPGEAELIARRQLEANRDPELQRMLALALSGQRKFIESAAELKTILQEHPEQILAYEALGQLIAQRPEDFPDIPSHWFNQAVENNPSSALAYIVRAGFYRRSKDLSKALADLERAEKQDLSDPVVRLRLAKELINVNALDRAERHLAAVQEATPEDQVLWQTWAELALKAQSQEKMLKVAENGLKELSSQPWDFMIIATELFIRCGRLEDANDCISKLNKKDIAPAVVVFLRGLVAAEQGHMLEAIKCWMQSLESGNKSAQVRLALASALYRLGNTQSAIWQLRTLVSENPASFDGHLALAKLLAQTGDWSETAKHAATAKTLSPENTEPALLHLQAQMQLLLTSSAGRKRLNDQTWQDMQERLSVLEETAESVGDVKLLRFQFALQQGKFAEAQAIVTELKETRLPRVRIAMAEAELLVAQDKLDEAVLRLNQATEEFHQNVDIVRYLAILLDRQGNREKCVAVIQDTFERVEQPVNHRELGLLLAHFYTRWGQRDDAYSLLITLAQKLPEDIPIKRRLLLCEQVIKDSKQAQQLVNDIKSLEGEDGWQWRYEQARVWFTMDGFKGRYPQIVSLLQENMLANPNDQTSRMLLASAYERAGELQLSLSTYREALSRSPDDLRVIIPTVAALYSAREYDEAEQVLSRASRQKLYHPELQKLQFQSYLRRGQLDSASGILQDLLSNDPNNQAACLSLALLKLQQGEFDTASELLTKLKIQNPNSLPVTDALIQLNIRRNKPSEALRLSEELLNKLKNASAYILRARTYAKLGQIDRAIKDLEHAVSIEPNNFEAWIARSDFYHSVGQTEKATADIQQALSLASDNVQIQKRAILLFLVSSDPNKINEGKVLLEKALESNAQDVQLRLLKARSVLSEGTAPAIKSAQRILQTIAEDKPEISEAWVLLGEIAINQGQPGKAMEAALGGLAYGPNNKALLLLKARAEAARSPILAVPTLKVLHELDPNDVGAAILLSNTYIRAGEPQKAEELLRKQLTTCDVSERQRYKIALAVALYRDGNEGEAQKEFDSLLESGPNDPGPLLAQVQLLKEDKLWSRLREKIIDWYQKHPKDSLTPTIVARDLIAIEDSHAQEIAENILRMILRADSDNIGAISVLAILLEITGRSEESTELYQRILELEPDNLIAINNLAWIICEKQGKYKQALELAQRGLKIAPNYIDLIDTRGVVYYRLDELEKAIQDFSKCIELYPSTTPAGVATRFHLARAFAELGQKDKAIEHLNEALYLESRIGGLSTAELAEAEFLLKQLQEGS